MLGGSLDIGLGAFLSGIVGTTLSIAAQFAGLSSLLGLGAGGMERLAAYPADLWLVAAGLSAIAEASGWRSRVVHRAPL